MQLDLIPKVPTRRERLERARERASIGIDRAAEATERRIEGWCEQACEELRQFAKRQSGMFTVELARGAIEQRLPAPRDLRAWGRVTRMAAARGFIQPVRCMYFPAASSNGSHKPVYRRGPKA